MLRSSTSGVGRTGSTVRRRIGWTVTDQVLSTGTNFALNIVVARSVAPEVFGAFSIAYVTYLLWRGVTWALCSEPFIIRFGMKSATESGEAVRSSVGASLGLGAVAAVVTGAAAVLVGGAVGGALLALAVVLPALLVQEAVRSLFLGRAEPRRAASNDAIWGVTQLGAVLWLLHLGRASAAVLLLAWGLSAAIAAIVGLFELRVLPDPRRLPGWVRDHRTLGPWLTMEFLLTRGSSQITFYALGWVASLGAVASVRAAQVFVGPLTVLFSAAQVSMVAEGVRLVDRSLDRLVRGVRAASALLAVGSACFGVAICLLPDRLGELLVGPLWADTRPLLPIMAAAVVARAVTVGAASGSRALGEAKGLLAARAVVAPVSIGAGVIGAAAFGAAGAATSFFITAFLSAVLYWRQFLRQVATASEHRGSRPETPRAAMPQAATQQSGDPA